MGNVVLDALDSGERSSVITPVPLIIYDSLRSPSRVHTISAS
jgi:hypothetical protein